MKAVEQEIAVLISKYEQNYQHYFIFVKNYHRQSEFLIAYLTILGTITYYLLVKPPLVSGGIQSHIVYALALTISASIFFFLVSHIMDSLYGIYRLNAIIEVIESRLDDMVGVNFNTISIFVRAVEPKFLVSPSLIWGAMGLIIYVLVVVVHFILSIQLVSTTFSVVYIPILCVFFGFFVYQWQNLKRLRKTFRSEIEFKLKSEL